VQSIQLRARLPQRLLPDRAEERGVGVPDPVPLL